MVGDTVVVVYLNSVVFVSRGNALNVSMLSFAAVMKCGQLVRSAVFEESGDSASSVKDLIP